MEFWTELDAVADRWSVLRHPFYTRWSAGELTADELAVYSGQYRHAVVALADASVNAAAVAEPGLRPGLERHAEEETSHIALWDEFARAVGGDREAPATEETEACAQAWAGDGTRSLVQSLGALYAIESAQPAIAETKLDGLRQHYGIDSSTATEYFTLHAELDKEHAAAGRALLEDQMTEADGAAVLAEAEAVLAANWRLLDGVERLNSRA